MYFLVNKIHMNIQKTDFNLLLVNKIHTAMSSWYLNKEEEQTVK